MAGLQSRLPVILVAGFLGSGKTTLVRTHNSKRLLLEDYMREVEVAP